MFVKLFEQILDSSIAENYKTRLVFEDMLLLADRHGIVDITHEALARRTNIPLDIVKTAITELEQPDARSRRADHDGRRIIRLDEHRDWGWHIVNFEYYKNIRNDEERTAYMRDYIKSYRAKGKDKSRPVNNGKQMLTRLANAEAEADAEADADKNKNAAAPLAYSVEFESFYQAYPRKTAKVEAYEAWKKSKRRPELPVLITAIEKQKQSKQWREEIIPHPATWINQERWNDEGMQTVRKPAGLNSKAVIRDRAIREIVLSLEASKKSALDTGDYQDAINAMSDKYRDMPVVLKEALEIIKGRQRSLVKV